MENQTTLNTLTVSALISNLSVSTLSVDSAMSNAQKSAERVEWFTDALKNNRLTDFLGLIEDTLNALPEGTNEVAVIHPVTGVKSTKKVNKRDIAKAAYKTAFNHAVKLAKVKKFEGKQLTFKLSSPSLSDKKAPATLADKVANLLKDSIDNKGLVAIMDTIHYEQERHAESVKELAKEHRAIELKATVNADIATFLTRGKTIEQAQELAAALNDLTVDELKEAIA